MVFLLDDEKALYTVLDDFYKSDMWDKDENIKSFIHDISLLCIKDKCKCRPRYHDVAKFVIDNWQEEDTLDFFVSALKELREKYDKELTANICDTQNDPQGVKCLDDFLVKIIDHIELEKLRLNSLSDSLKKEYLQNEMQRQKFSEELDRQKKVLALSVHQIEQTVSWIEEDSKKLRTELSSHKFDVIALTTLIFSAFTMIQVNVTTFSALADKALGNIVLMMSIVNIIVITTIMAIYSVIRKIHGDIGDEELYKNIFIMLLILIISGLFGRNIL